MENFIEIAAQMIGRDDHVRNAVRLFRRGMGKAGGNEHEGIRLRRILAVCHFEPIGTVENVMQFDTAVKMRRVYEINGFLIGNKYIFIEIFIDFVCAAQNSLFLFTLRCSNYNIAAGQSQ